MSIAFDPSGKVIAFGGLTGRVGLIDAADGSSLGTLIELGKPVGDVTFNHEGNQLVVGCDDDLAYLWKINELDAPIDYEMVSRLREHTGYVNGVVFSPDDSLLVTSSHDGNSWIWNLTNQLPSQKLTGQANALLRGTFNPQGTLIATVSWDGTVNLYGAEK